MTHYAPMVAALVTMMAIVILLFSKPGREIQDVPNERSLHAAPIPRIGGIGMMIGILAAWAFVFSALAWWTVLPVLILFAVSLRDDMHGLPVVHRLSAHIAAAVILVAGSGLFAQGLLLALLALFAAVWMTNLYNFMDGSDGLAGGMTFFGFTMYGIAALMHGSDAEAMLNFAISASALGFLYYNVHPARVFMGDAGSIPLGFLAAAMGLRGWQLGNWPLWFPVLVFSPFILDATVTLVKRTLRGEKIWQAHREHYYQRLVQIGWGHKNVALLFYALMFASGVSAVLGAHGTVSPAALLLSWAAVYALLMLALDWRWKSFSMGRHER